MNNHFDIWQPFLICPLDHTLLQTDLRCPTCGFEPASVNLKGRQVPDFRAIERLAEITTTFHIPHQPLNRDAVREDYFRAINQSFPHFSRREVRRLFGTKIDKGIQFYAQQLFKEVGEEARILDLGCGSGGNRRYLQSLGFKNVLTVDWLAEGADLLVDAHRLPLSSGGFDMVLSTAVFEHLYNPFLAMSEVGRVLKNGGYFVGGASFWEGWHGSSYFHLTPDGWNVLFQHAGLQLEDLWPGWGIIPAALTHVLTPGYLRGFGYMLQNGVDGAYRLLVGSQRLRKMQLRASGSYQVFARKTQKLVM